MKYKAPVSDNAVYQYNPQNIENSYYKTYDLAYEVEPKRVYYTTLNELSTTFNGFTAVKSKLVLDANPPQYCENERRRVIVEHFVDKRRAFNYSKELKRHRPYAIARNAYDYNYFNYGFTMKEV